MENMERAFGILQAVLKEKKNYFEETSKVVKRDNLSKEENYKLVQFVGSFLRNYYFICYVEEYLYCTKKIDVTILLGLYYINCSYIKLYEQDEARERLAEHLKDYDLELSDIQRRVLDDICKQRRNYYFNTLQKGGLESLSVRFNLPKWFIKMMFKQYGKEVALKTCKAIAKMPVQFCVKNEFVPLTVEEQTLFHDLDEIRPGLFEYKGHSSLRKHPLVKKRKVFQVQAAYMDLFDELGEIKDKTVSIYLGNKNNIYYNILSRYAADNTINIFTKHLYENYDLLTKIRDYHLNKTVHYNEANEDGLDGYLADKPQDLILYWANSSEFEEFRTEPDSTVVFDPTTLDDFVTNELDGLKALKSHVALNGQLVYAVRTIGLKETKNIVEEFMKDNKEFELVSEKQFFPYEDSNSIFYYAIFKRVASNDEN